MQTEVLDPTAPIAKAEKPRHKGVFEKIPGSGVWWIRYHDAGGKLRREKAGTRGMAVKLYQKRKIEALQGKKLPENLRRAGTPTLREFGQRFVDEIEVRCAGKPNTVPFTP